MPENASTDGALAGLGPRTHHDPLIGQTLDGRYKIERVLGEGGMGIVYKAVHTTLGKPLAIKVLRPEVSKNEEIVQRFRQEAQSASQIGNPHIIDISDFGVLADGSTYFVMEFLTGKSLTAALLEGKFSLARTLDVVRQLAGALGAAHEIGIVHRDMKPDNVQLVERGGQKDFVKVLDFGIAKVGGSTSKLTQAGQVFGTPHYMSPEQCAGTNVDHRTDIYAVGVMLYEMACGQVPFDADNLMGILTKHLYENPIAPRELGPTVDVSPELEAIILKCLQKKPEARYQSMAELAADLEAVERGLAPKGIAHKPTRVTGGTLTGVEARIAQDGGAQDVAIRKRRTPLVLALSATALLLIAGAVVALSRGSGSDAQKAAVAEAPPPQPTAAVVPATVSVTPEPPAEAKLTISSNPPNAEVWQDGKVSVGNTPYTIDRPKGKKLLNYELRLPGYISHKLEISAQSQSLTAQLEREEHDERAEQAEKPKAKPEPSKPARPAAHAARRAHAEAPKAERAASRARAQSEVLDPWN